MYDFSHVLDSFCIHCIIMGDEEITESLTTEMVILVQWGYHPGNGCFVFFPILDHKLCTQLFVLFTTYRAGPDTYGRKCRARNRGLEEICFY